ncbi:hypothetical protein Dsin_027256 [Dipteronia sinensis]|uniref:Aconitase/3-isopropylmalate dehydratase large subunit alpha/beta/alpha domain-containing protein n=1 Tax=Dipteronia sinensis TaxID=43782 RepID=A0AAD9ZND5_9ROSI|nr:hypothetical protein Dsin_027256 [Dipteronia sinensis]
MVGGRLDQILQHCAQILYHYYLTVWNHERLVIIPDHYIFTSDERANCNIDILRDFCTEQNIKYFYDIKDLINFKVNLITKVYVMLNLLKKVPPTLRFVMDGEMPDYLLAKDLILQMEERTTLCNMVVEAGGKNGVVPADSTAFKYLEDKTSVGYEPVYSDEKASVQKYLGGEPHSPDNRALARECKDVKIDRVYIGSCTGGKTEDFLAAAKVFQASGKKVKVPTFLVPATQKVWMDVYNLPVPGSGGKTCSQIFEEASPSCGACLGGPKDIYARMNEPMAKLRTNERCQMEYETMSTYKDSRLLKSYLPFFSISVNYGYPICLLSILINSFDALALQVDPLVPREEAEECFAIGFAAEECLALLAS